MTFEEYGAMIAREYFVYYVEPVLVTMGLRVETYAVVNGAKVFIDSRDFTYDELFLMEKNENAGRSNKGF